MPDRAIEVLKAAIPQFMHQGANSYLIRALTALSVAYVHKEQHHLALNAFEKAVKLAQPEENVGDFLVMGRTLAPVLKLASKHANLGEYSSRLINLLQLEAVHKTRSSERETGSSTLSQRELDVLSLIEDGLTSREIAEALYLSRNTIKSHRSSIYRKLNVGTRDQAISKARMLGILAKQTDAYTWRSP
jgi:LuxR family maltose regulon positive regulatory protein